MHRKISGRFFPTFRLPLREIVPPSFVLRKSTFFVANPGGSQTLFVNRKMNLLESDEMLDDAGMSPFLQDFVYTSPRPRPSRSCSTAV